jgi:UDP-3-O-[3-hydroxymyristoyl] glucosamine N-acyltransferase
MSAAAQMGRPVALFGYVPRIARPGAGGKGQWAIRIHTSSQVLRVARICDGTSMGSQATLVQLCGVSGWTAVGQITTIGHATELLDRVTSCDRYAWTRDTKFDACSAWDQYSALPPNPLMTVLAFSAVWT